jgi:archaellum biogenesis ATPase FlaH
MYRKDVSERSPMRVFENSMHGGLGRGNLGVVASRAGVGKTTLLVQIAIDDLIRERRVLHISHEHAVDHVRAYYDEIFHEIAEQTQLENVEQERIKVERRRLIYSHLGYVKTGPTSHRGGMSSIKKIRETVAFAHEVAHFDPDVIVIDGFDFHGATEEGVRDLVALAKELEVEVWASATTQVYGLPKEMPPPIDKFLPFISVLVYLEPQHDVVHLRLLKDHENNELASLHLRLDPHSMRVVDDDMPPVSLRPRSPRRFRLHSGGARGAEAEFGICAERFGLTETNYSFDGHRLIERHRGVVVLSDEELKRGDFSLLYASKRLGRVLSDIPLVRSVLQTIWHQINEANQVFVVGVIQPDGTVRGGTGWGAELARLWKKPIFVFDQVKKAWFWWSGSGWEPCQPPVITSESFAGTGTQDLTEEGRQAIRKLFSDSFDP